MLFRLLIVITAFIGFVFFIETIRYILKFKLEMTFFRFITKTELSALTLTIITLSCIPYILTIIAFVGCYVIHGDISYMIEYFSK